MTGAAGESRKSPTKSPNGIARGPNTPFDLGPSMSGLALKLLKHLLITLTDRHEKNLRYLGCIL